MFSVYIIYSAKIDKYYIGYTENMAKRLADHNSGISDFTSKASDWVVKRTEAFSSRQEAMKRKGD